MTHLRIRHMGDFGSVLDAAALRMRTVHDSPDTEVYFVSWAEGRTAYAGDAILYYPGVLFFFRLAGELAGPVALLLRSEAQLISEPVTTLEQLSDALAYEALTHHENAWLTAWQGKLPAVKPTGALSRRSFRP